MAQYIERAKAIDVLIDNPSIVGSELKEAVDAICAIPAADVRPVVLCKNCSFSKDGGYFCTHPMGLKYALPNYFCFHGDRRADG